MADVLPFPPPVRDSDDYWHDRWVDACRRWEGERDAALAENAKLREALKPILYALDDDGEMQDFRGGARDRLGRAVRAARALVEAPR